MSKSDTGESTASINARGDDASWPSVLKQLQRGCTLVRLSGLDRYGVDDGRTICGPSLSKTRIRKLEKDGVIEHTGVDRYGLVNEP